MVVQMSLMLSVYSMLGYALDSRFSPYRYFSKIDADLAVYTEPKFGRYQFEFYEFEWPTQPLHREYLGSRVVLLDIKTDFVKILGVVEHASQPAISPDGKCITWIEADDDAKTQLKIYNRDTDEVTSFSEEEERFTYRLNWTPDGKTIVYTSERGLRFFSIDEQEVVKAIPATSPGSIAISPDGKYLIYSQVDFEEGNWTLHRHNLEDGTFLSISELDHGNVVGAQLFWSPDSSKIFTWRYEREGEDLHPHNISHHFLFFNKDLELLGEPKENPTVIQQNLHPWANEIDISHWLKKDESKE